MTLEEALWQDPDRMSGAVCFRGTRLPVGHLFDYLRAGRSVDEFLEHYPDATKEMVEAVLTSGLDLIEIRIQSEKQSA